MTPPVPATRILHTARILEALADDALTTREVHVRLLERRWQEWEAESGISVDDYLPGRLLAWGREHDLGVALDTAGVYRHLRRLEREGKVSRVQLPGHRPMLWRATRTVA